MIKKILLIVDPQNDFITGTLAVPNAKHKMMKLAEYLKNNSDKYDYICLTMDSHPENHCSFVENGGIWPKHCVAYTNGWDFPEYLNEELYKTLPSIIGAYHKGTDPFKEEYSIFNNDEDGNTLENHICELIDAGGCTIDVCGIAGDFCVLETIKGLRRIIGDRYINILTPYIASIDGGEKLMNYIKDNNLNYE